MPDPHPAPPLDLPGRRDRERLARRRAMLDAALAVFGDKGFDGATVDEIAERAEFGKGTLYNYFPGGKDELYAALFEEVVLDGLLGVVAEAFPAGVDLTTPGAARRAFCGLIEGLVRHFDAHHSHFLMFMRDGHRRMLDAEQAAFFVSRFERVIDAVTAPIEDAMAAGAMRRLPARPVAHLLMGNVRGHLMASHEAACPAAAHPVGGSAGSGSAPAAPFLTPADAASFITTVLFDGLLADPA